MRSLVGALALLTLSIGLVSTAAAEEPASDDHAIRLSGHAGVGLGGAQGPIDMDPSIYIGGRIDSAVHPWVAVGGQLQVQLWRNDAMNAYNSRFDFDAVGKLRHVYHVGDHELEAYLVVPFGFTLATVKQNNTNPGPGYNVGALVGAWLFLTEHYALSLEVGWMYHHTYHNFEGIGGSASIEFDDHQAVLLLGGAFR